MSRADGNALFTKGMYAEAIAIYEKLVDDSAALSNAAEACLQLRRFSDAESFARKSLELDEKNGKSRSRLARAMASQNKSVAAHLFLATIADETERAAAHQRLVECEGQLTLFLGKVVVRSNSEDQFGLFAAGDMLPGELVLREKRLCSFGRADVIQDDERAKEVLAFFDSEEGHKVEDALEGVFPRGRGAVPAMLERVTELSAGSERSKSDLWAAAHFFSVLFFSSFEIGLFSLASVFNHSCGANCDIVPLDLEHGVLEWRTNRFVKRGEELTFSYLPLETLCLPVQIRRSIFSKNWGGNLCECTRCAMEAEVGPDKDATQDALEKFSTDLNEFLEKSPYNFTNEKIEALLRGKCEALDWKGSKWQTLLVYSWYLNHCMGFLRKSRTELKRSLNFGGPLGRAVDRALDYYDLLQEVVPERSSMLNPVRESVVSMLKLALEVDNVVSQKLKNKDAIRNMIGQLEAFYKKDDK